MTEAVPDPNIYAREWKLYPNGEVRWIYDFRCPACNACGELSVPSKLHDVWCPEHIDGENRSCQARFVHFRLPNKEMPALRCLNEAQATQHVALLQLRVAADRAHQKWTARRVPHLRNV